MNNFKHAQYKYDNAQPPEDQEEYDCPNCSTLIDTNICPECGCDTDEYFTEQKAGI